MANQTLFRETDENILAIFNQLNHLREIQIPGLSGPAVSAEKIAIFVETAYWSSLLFNEGRRTSVRIVAAMPTSSSGMLQFAEPVPFNERQIAKLAPAVPPLGCLLVDPEAKEILAICGREFARCATLILEVERPGVVRVGLDSRNTFLVFAGRDTVQVDGIRDIQLAHLIRSVFPAPSSTDDVNETQAVWREALALAMVARVIRTNGHGGALLLVPDANDEWSDSIDPFRFCLNSRDGAIPDSIRAELNSTSQIGAVLEAASEAPVSGTGLAAIMGGLAAKDFGQQAAIDSVARLAAVDGAVILTSRGRLVGFGAKIASNGAQPLEIFSTVPSSEELQRASRCALESLGGMRHQSAARFVGKNHGCAALVVSEDGPMSFMSWNADWNGVHVIKNVDWWC